MGPKSIAKMDGAMAGLAPSGSANDDNSVWALVIGLVALVRIFNSKYVPG